MPEVAVENVIVLEIFGEGKSDFGKESAIGITPDQGVVPIIVHRLCGKPTTMRVKTKRYAHLQGKKSLWQKVWFAKRQAYYNQGTCGAVFVLDTEGDDQVITNMAKGRDHGLPQFPMAIGAPRPCIEAWLLADSSALRLALALNRSPELPEDPESLPAPRVNRKQNPKTVLAEHDANSQTQKDKVARRFDLNTARQRCVRSFEPFAIEVEKHLRPLFA
jgi:hypothetical protein